ncbi:MAG: universal stress protein [Geminicoccaceae bacterium]
MSKLILAAVDLSHADDQQSILAKASDLAALEQAKLAVIAVIPDFGMSIVGSFFPKDAAKNALAKAKTDLDQFIAQGLGQNADVEPIVQVGNAYEKILKTAEKLDASTIVIGAHRPNFEDYLLGPHAARVVRHANCSVFVVRD